MGWENVQSASVSAFYQQMAMNKIKVFYTYANSLALVWCIFKIVYIFNQNSFLQTREPKTKGLGTRPID